MTHEIVETKFDDARFEFQSLMLYFYIDDYWKENASLDCMTYIVVDSMLVLDGGRGPVE